MLNFSPVGRLSLAVSLVATLMTSGCSRDESTVAQPQGEAVLTLTADHIVLSIDGLFFETADGRTTLPSMMASTEIDNVAGIGQVTLPDGRVVSIGQAERPNSIGTGIALSAIPDDDILGWGFAVEAESDEYFTGLMERVVDGPQQASWAPGISEAMDLRGQTVEMIVRPTTSVYAPFYLSSRGYAIAIGGTWPGTYDFAAAERDRVLVTFEGPSLDFVVYLSDEPADLVQAHAMEVGPPLLPPEWAFGHFRWRDEHRHRDAYYDGTPVNGPFNSESMEDVLMMDAYGIPNSVYWIDRPYGPGSWGYDDFEIDPERLPSFEAMVRWLESKGQRTLLWIAPFLEGDMETEALERGFTLPGQERPANGNNYPLVDLTNPDAREFWQDGVQKLLDLGVTAFKLDRAEEDIPDGGPFEIFDGRSLREQRNDYPVMYIEAAWELISAQLGDDFLLMPRAAYTGSTRYGVFWGGDIGGTQEGLRASIIAMQRAAVMGYPNWGSDTCGYNQQLMEQEVCGRWLAFSALSPIMEVGPTRNVAFWNLPREPEYDQTLIALWRMYARLHERLRDYSYEQAQLANATGMPIVRPLFLADPDDPQAWSNWWTYMYGPDLLVSPVWEKGVREQQVYLPARSRWRDVWTGMVYEGGKTATVAAEPHQLPLFVREGSGLELGDLETEWEESLEIASVRPDLAALEQSVIDWFADNGGAGE
jgi:alpha-D-xyloside xylohydrolase